MTSGHPMRSGIVFYHNGPIDLPTAGSKVRPRKVLEYLSAQEPQVFPIVGTHRERLKSFFQLLFSQKNTNRYRYIYFENSTTPLFYRKLKLAGLSVPFISLQDALSLWVAKKYGYRVAYYVRDIQWDFPDLYVRKHQRFLLYFLKYLGLLELKFARSVSDMILCPSEPFADFLEKNFGIKAIPLSPGSDLRISEPLETPEPGEALNLLYVGGLGGLYDPTLFIEALSEMKETPLQLTICTREAEWQRYAANHSIPDFVRPVFVSGEGLKELYGKAHICVNFMPPKLYSFLSFPVKMAEYIASGRPIFIFQGSGGSSLVQKKNLGWAVSYDKLAVKKWLSEILESPKQINERAEQVRKARHEFCWSKVVSDLQAKLKSL